MTQTFYFLHPDGGWREVERLYDDVMQSPAVALVRDVRRGGTYWAPIDKLERIKKRSENDGV